MILPVIFVFTTLKIVKQLPILYAHNVTMVMFWALMGNALHLIPLLALTPIADCMTTLYLTNAYNVQMDFSSTLKESVNKLIHCAKHTTVKTDYV